MSYITDMPPLNGAPGTTMPVVSGSAALPLSDAIKYQTGQQSGDRAQTVVIYIETANIRIAYNATPVPATPFGYPILAGKYLVLDKWEEIDNIQHIREGSTDADLTVTGYF
jgi:hypothetical protein